MALQHIFAGDLANLAGNSGNVPVPLVLRPLAQRVGNCVIGDIGSTPFVGPLDAFTTGLQAMFLPFRGLTAYAGDCFSIRDTTGDAIQSVGFDASGDCNTFSTAGSAAMAAWLNQTGSNNTSAIPNTTEPFVAQGVINGLPVARLDGVDDAAFASIANGTYQRTLYVVAKKRTAQDGSAIKCAVGLSTSAASFICDNTGSPALSGGWGWRASNFTTQIPLGGVVTDFSLLVFVSTDATTGMAYVNNGTGAVIDPSSGVTIATSLGLGIAASPSDCDIAGALLYNATHDDTTRQAIQSILASKFGITLP